MSSKYLLLKTLIILLLLIFSSVAPFLEKFLFVECRVIRIKIDSS